VRLAGSASSIHDGVSVIAAFGNLFVLFFLDFFVLRGVPEFRRGIILLFIILSDA
jgi:hypothetical protein